MCIRDRRVKTHQDAKFLQNRSIGCEDIKTFWFFKMAAAAILDCRIHKILLADSGWMLQTHHCTKLRQNRSLHCGDIAIFRIFKMAAAAVFDFWNREILLVIRVQRGDASASHILSKSFIPLRRCCNFSIFRMATASILDFWNCKILLAIGVERVETHQRAKIFSKSVKQLRRY